MKNTGTITNVDIPAVKTGSERQAKYRKTDKGKAARKGYMHRTSTWQTEASYLSRPFVAWDGEGVTVADGSHRYTLLASSSGFTVEDETGLSTGLIFRTLIAGKEETPNGIHVIYGGSYDFNMWLRDLSHRDLYRLYQTGACYWNDYRLQWRRGKSFRITDRNKGVTITIYDVVSFFQCPFVKACDDYLGDAFIEREMIVANKAVRGSFTAADAAAVAKYNDAELVNLVNLMNELRERLVKVHLRPKRWDGPGAIATALLQREGIKTAMAVCPEGVAEAARYAYAGGRFEVVKCGDVEGKAYEYDINSAYPAALRNVPNLARGRWLNVDSPLALSDDSFSLWNVEWEGLEENLFLPQPFYHRAPDGSVSYPLRNSGWYWAPEIVTALEYVERYGGSLKIKRGHVFIPTDVTEKPFDFINGMYLKRQALKKAGDGAHVGLKLGLNSLYGKTCQRVGYSVEKDGTIKTPPFHQLEWAGYVTSWCRAQVLRAALENLESVIAFETDAMFTTEPLPVKVGPGLGEWEYTGFDRLAYLQSGLYFGETADGKTVEKTRGVDRGSLTYAQCQKGLRSASHSDRYVDSQLTRFIGLGLAFALNNMERWTRWETAPKRVKLEPDGKRIHDNCIECSGGNGFASGTWHETYPPLWEMKTSCEYPIPWLNPNPDMTELDEWAAMHREEMAADYE